MRKCLPLLILALLLLTACLLYHFPKQQYLSTLKLDKAETTVILDAGHGGSDPGKIGINQVLEKDINLAITLECEKILKKKHINVILTRSEDVSLCEPDASNKKRSDMEARRTIIQESNANLAVSIHQNSFPSANVSGAQVFYYASSTEGKSLADTLQTTLLSCNPQNTRQPKASSDYFILKSAACPIVICECGFLSNPEECTKLNSKDYQKQVANAIATGILQYLKK